MSEISRFTAVRVASPWAPATSLHAARRISRRWVAARTMPKEPVPSVAPIDHSYDGVPGPCDMAMASCSAHSQPPGSPSGAPQSSHSCS
eukprot:scaffold48550_cov68-Phaeocystis_antarctica.AAC.10